jgi:hypothetical protein
MEEGYLDYISQPLAEVNLAKMCNTLLLGCSDNGMDMCCSVGVVAGKVGIEFDCTVL